MKKVFLMASLLAFSCSTNSLLLGVIDKKMETNNTTTQTVNYKFEEWFDGNLFTKCYPEIGHDPLNDPLIYLKTLPKGTAEPNGDDVVVSMTSHPPRIKTTWLSLLSVLTQNKKANKVILYLAKEDFPDEKIPMSLEFLKTKGLEVRFSEVNYKVATKILPAIKDFHKTSVIVTGDDDRIYEKHWLGSLLGEHTKHPKDIISPAARHILWNKGNTNGLESQNGSYVYPYPYPYPYSYLPSTDQNSEVVQNSLKQDKGMEIPTQQEVTKKFPHIDYLKSLFLYEDPTLGAIFEGFAGVLYPPNSLHKNVLDYDTFKLLTPVADDVWLQTMAFLQETPVRGLPKPLNDALLSPKEIEDTQDSGLFHQHLLANDWMLYRALYYYGLLDKLGFPSRTDLQCQDCRRDIWLPNPNNPTPKYTGSSKHKCKTCLNTDKRKVLSIGAYPYGNIGDRLYKEVLGNELGEDFEMHFVGDNYRINEQDKAVGRLSKDKDLPFDALIVGGGGILHNFPKTDFVHYYMTQAVEKGKPFFVVSTGLQTKIKEPNEDNARTILGDSTELLKKASLIFLRSARDGQLVKSVLGRDVDHKLFVAPDLGYLYPQIMQVPSNLSKKYVTVIQTGFCSVEKEYTRNLINKAFKEHSDAELVVMNWGGPEDPLKEKDFGEYDLFAKKTKEYYPNAKVFMGDSIAPELKELRYKNEKTRSSDLTPEQAVGIVAQSHIVFTGRYHGYIISKALGIPCEALDSTHKLTAEQETPLDITKTNVQLKKIREFVLRNSVSLPDPSTWSEDARNTSIIKLAQFSGFPVQTIVSFIQTKGNKQLWREMAYGGNLDK
ncbi:Polysaccharide pyruvyl transferase family protein [Candidatus Bealeia paramacronuclearis]|uniref:Polysaccharide pyruvyl transferase family protein n=1 Tax=Candidatus Bealeia paramacronuclearis TaxID=1921001 RepID=A0ABZ2C5K2_9PROT|nr:Polysaccharide pyruvyl transferase family protein [Candidatus Bealeia paramacronuclearis]